MLISGRPSSRVPVRAVTVITEVMSVPELVMNCLAPLIDPAAVGVARRAVVAVAEASEPASGSVSPNAASA